MLKFASDYRMNKKNQRIKNINKRQFQYRHGKMKRFSHQDLDFNTVAPDPKDMQSVILWPISKQVSIIGSKPTSVSDHIDLVFFNHILLHFYENIGGSLTYTAGFPLLTNRL